MENVSRLSVVAVVAVLAEYRTADFFDHLERGGKLVLCRPEVDLAHAGNVRVQASMTNGVLRSEDPVFLKVQRARLKFFVPSAGKLYGLGTDCGPKLKANGVRLTTYSHIAE